MTTGSIHYDDLILVLPEVGNTSLSNLHRVSLVLVTIERTLDLGSVHLELSEGTGTECVSAHDTHLPAFLHVVIGEFCASRCLTSTLETNKHDDIGFATLELIRLVIGGQHVRKLIDHRLLDDTTQLCCGLSRTA